MAGDRALKLFVYGTLRRGAPMHGLVAGRADWIGPAHAPGTLVDLGSFPGLVTPLSPGDRVHGDLFALAPATSDVLLDALDRYEGPKFRRERASVVGPVGSVEAWVFRFTGDTRGAQVVPGGDYLRSA